jgi:hypothetical protein
MPRASRENLEFESWNSQKNLQKAFLLLVFPHDDKNSANFSLQKFEIMRNILEDFNWISSMKHEQWKGWASG